MTSFVARPFLTAVYGSLTVCNQTVHYAIKNCRKDLGMRSESDPVTVCGMLGQGLDYMIIVVCIISV